MDPYPVNQLGQLFCTPLRWEEFPNEEAIRAALDRVIEMNLCGLIVFGGDREATPRLLGELQGRADPPLMIMADVENGTAQQISGGTDFPGMMALGATRSPELTYRVAEATARESIELGINVVLAPVLDISTNPLNPIVGTRSFGDDPDLVADLGSAYVTGCQDAGALATAKHFPGHGDTDVDSHLDLPVVRRGPGSLQSIELRPFERAISTGVASVMVGHIAFPSVTGDESLPASASREIVTGLLREKLGFDRLVMTDAMIMAGAHRKDGEVEPVVDALAAGIDLLLYVKDDSSGIEAVKAALGTGRLESSRVDQAILRIKATRERLARPTDTGGETAGRVGCRDHRDLAQEVADSAATLVRNRGGFFPLAAEESSLFVIVEDDGKAGDRILAERLRETFPDVPRVSIDTGAPDLPSGEVAKIESAEKAVFFVFTAIRAWRGEADLSPGGRNIVGRLIDRSRHAGIVSLGSPYLMRYFPGIDGFACLYSPSLPSQESAVRLLSGELFPSGVLPVSIPGLYPAAWSVSAPGPRSDP